MSKHSSLPTSRSRRRGRRPARNRARPAGTAAGASWLVAGAAAARRVLWAEPVARYWAPSDDVFVVRLVKLREQLDELAGAAPLGMYAAVLALEKTLYLTPAARRERLKAAVTDPPPAAASGGRAPTSSRRGRAAPVGAGARAPVARLANFATFALAARLQPCESGLAPKANR